MTPGGKTASAPQTSRWFPRISNRQKWHHFRLTTWYAQTIEHFATPTMRLIKSCDANVAKLQQTVQAKLSKILILDSCKFFNQSNQSISLETFYCVTLLRPVPASEPINCRKNRGRTSRRCVLHFVSFAASLSPVPRLSIEYTFRAGTA